MTRRVRESELDAMRQRAEKAERARDEVEEDRDEKDLEVTRLEAQVERLRVALNETPAQSLREIRAEAGREGWIRCAHWMKDAAPGSNINRAGSEYAQQIREGKE